VERALRDDVRHFMDDDAGNRSRKNPSAIDDRLGAKFLSERLRNSVAVDIDKGLDVLIDHQYPAKWSVRQVVAVARRGHSAIPLEPQLVDVLELHALAEFVSCHPPDRSSQQVWRFGLLKLGFQNGPKAVACRGGEVDKHERFVGKVGLPLCKQGESEEQAQERSKHCCPNRDGLMIS
jgi:hypothetical protein